MSPDERYLFAAGSAADYVCVYTLPDLKLQKTIPVGSEPNWIVFDTEGRYAYVSNRKSNNLSVISVADGREVARIDTGREPHEVEVNASGMIAVVSNYGPVDALQATLTRIDLRTLEVSPIDLGRHTRPHGLAWLPDGRHLLVGEVNVLELSVSHHPQQVFVRVRLPGLGRHAGSPVRADSADGTLAAYLCG